MSTFTPMMIITRFIKSLGKYFFSESESIPKLFKNKGLYL